MKAAFFVYPSAFQNKGGGEILLEKTEEYLLKKGVHVKRFDMWNDRIEDFDILHVFGSVKDCLPLMEVAKARGVKVILESIFWSDFRRAFHEQGSIASRTDKVLRHAVKLFFPFFPSSRKKMFEVADAIFPNSENEAKQISRLFAIPMEKMIVIPNGVDRKFSEANGRLFSEKYPFKDFVLSAGRIEPRKNTLNLIRGMRGISRDLVVVGEPVAVYGWYYEMCRSEAGENVHFIGKLGHGSDLLMSAYAACDVFVLPGWFETPGLAALEAGLAGAKIVVTEGGSTGEYFGEHALYLRPDDPKDIHDKIEKAIHAGKDARLKELILREYTWDKIAEKTIEAYERVIRRAA